MIFTFSNVCIIFAMQTNTQNRNKGGSFMSIQILSLIHSRIPPGFLHQIILIVYQCVDLLERLMQEQIKYNCKFLKLISILSILILQKDSQSPCYLINLLSRKKNPCSTCFFPLKNRILPNHFTLDSYLIRMDSRSVYNHIT